MRIGDERPGRFHESESPWLRSFALDAMKILVVCRGPVRQEAFDIFDEIGVREYGMLLSEKDSVVYPRCLAPELRSFRFPANVHRVRDVGLRALRERYERELMNPNEALSLSSVSRIVMPGTSRRVLGEHLAFLMRTYQPSPMGGVQRESE